MMTRIVMSITGWPFLRNFSSSKLGDPLLPRIAALVRDLRSTSKHWEKQLIIQKFSDLHPFLRFFSELGPLHMTRKSAEKCIDLELYDEQPPPTIEELLRLLNERTVTGHAALALVQKFIQENEESKELILDLIERDLRIGMASRLLRKTLNSEPLLELANVQGARHITNCPPRSQTSFPRTSKDLPIALGYSLQHPSIKLDRLGEAGDWWLISRKLDGIRCLALWDKKTGISLWTRAGNRLSHLRNVDESMRKLSQQISLLVPKMDSFYIDGELCSLTTGSADNQASIVEDFSSALSIVLSTDSPQKEEKRRKLVFFAFDFFNNCNLAKMNLSSRLDLLQNAFQNVQDSIKNDIQLLGQYRTRNIEEFRDLLAKSQTNKWEGLIIRRDAPHRAGRSRDIIKVKDFYEAEFYITDYRLETMSIIKDGRVVDEELLSAVKVDFGGKDVWVGSGFSQEERRKYAINPQQLCGCQATVRYFQESSNAKDGLKSLRFPIIKAIYPGQRQV